MNLLPDLIKLVFNKREEVNQKFTRVLPVGDYISDRWEKAKYCGFGEGSSVYDSSLILGKVSVGFNTWIGPFTVLDGSGGSLEIGNNCNISAGVQIYTHDTINKVIYSKEIEQENTKIGNNVYLGPNVVVSKGVNIGDFVVIGANSFVDKDIPSHTKCYGTPVEIIEGLS